MNSKIKDFLNGENTVEIRDKSEFQDFVNLLKRDGVINSVFLHYNDFDYNYWVQIVCASASKGTYDMVFEHDPATKGVALYTDRRKSMDWYGKGPYTVPELERAGV